MSSTKIGSAPASEKSAKKIKKEKKERTARPDFDLETAVDADGNQIPLDDDGNLTAVPTNWDRSCAPLKRGSFATPVLYAEYKLFLFDEATRKRDEQRQELVADVEEAKLGKDSKKAKTRKAERLKAQYAALAAELAEQGIDLSAI